VKTKFPPIEAKIGEEFYPFLNARLQNQDVDLVGVLREAIKVPEIMENNVKPAIERQGGGIVFLNLIVENTSSVLEFLSEHKRLELTIQYSVNLAVNMLNNELNIPLVICFHAVHCNYQIYSLTIPIPTRKENGKTTIDASRL
jgi:hypothetical protein